MSDDKDKIVELYKKAERKKGLSPAMREAYIEDENIRKNAQRISFEYLECKQKLFSNWMWFVFGCLFVVIVESIVLNTSIFNFLTQLIK